MYVWWRWWSITWLYLWIYILHTVDVFVPIPLFIIQSYICGSQKWVCFPYSHILSHFSLSKQNSVLLLLLFFFFAFYCQIKYFSIHHYVLALLCIEENLICETYCVRYNSYHHLLIYICTANNYINSLLLLL